MERRHSWAVGWLPRGRSSYTLGGMVLGMGTVGRGIVGMLHEEAMFEMSPRDPSCMVGRCGEFWVCLGDSTLSPQASPCPPFFLAAEPPPLLHSGPCLSALLHPLRLHCQHASLQGHEKQPLLTKGWGALVSGGRSRSGMTV